MLTRRGSSVAELLVALALSGVILAVATASLLRQGRNTTTLTTLGRQATQVATASALLPAQLALLAPSAEDLVPAELSDTALQLRAAVATGLACDGLEPLTLAVDDGDPPASGMASSIRAGDSLWRYLPDSTRWAGRVVADAWTDSTECRAAEAAGAAPGPRRVVRVRSEGEVVPVPYLAAVRVTRQVRFAVYRSGDGTWQLGYREWSNDTRSLAAIQPVAGPLLRVAPDGARSGFRYFDAGGDELHPPEDPLARVRIARIRFTALAPPSPAGMATLQRAAPRDSADVAIAPLVPP